MYASSTNCALAETTPKPIDPPLLRGKKEQNAACMHITEEMKYFKWNQVMLFTCAGVPVAAAGVLVVEAGVAAEAEAVPAAGFGAAFAAGFCLQKRVRTLRNHTRLTVTRQD